MTDQKKPMSETHGCLTLFKTFIQHIKGTKKKIHTMILKYERIIFIKLMILSTDD